MSTASSTYTPRATDSPDTLKTRICASVAVIAGAESGSTNAAAYKPNVRDRDREELSRVASALAAWADAKSSRNGVVFVSAGDVTSRSPLVLGAVTTNATATVLTTNGKAVSGATNLFVVPTNTVTSARISIVGTTANGAVVGHYVREAVIRNTANTVSLVGSVATDGADAADGGASSWSVAVTADNTNKALQIAVTGAASTTIRWVARVDTLDTKF